MMHIVRLCLAVALLSATPLVARADVLFGYITDDDELAIPDTIVELSSGGSVVASTLALGDGYYALTVPAGTYDLRVDPPAASGYLESTIPGVVVSGSTQRDVVLTPIQFVLEWTIRRSNDDLMPNVRVALQGPNIPSLTWFDPDPATGALPDVTVRAGDYQVRIERDWSTTRDDDANPATPAESVRTKLRLTGGVLTITGDRQLDLRVPLVDLDLVVEDARGAERPGSLVARASDTTQMLTWNSDAPVLVGGLSFTSFDGELRVANTGGDGTASLVVPATRTNAALALRAIPPAADKLVPTPATGLAWTTDAVHVIVCADMVRFSGHVTKNVGGVVTPIGTTARVTVSGQDAYGNSNARTITCDASGAFADDLYPAASVNVTVQQINTAVIVDDDGNGATPAEEIRSAFALTGGTLAMTAPIDRTFEVPLVTLTLRVTGPDGGEVPRASTVSTTFDAPAPVTIGGVAFAGFSGSLLVTNTGADGTARIVLPATAATETVSITASPPSGLGLFARAFPGLTWPTDVTHVLQLSGLVTLSGSILRADTLAPIFGARIRIEGPTDLGLRAPAADGSFSFQVEPGTYDIALENTFLAETYDEDADPTTLPMAERRLNYIASATGVSIDADTVRHFRLPLTDVCFEITTSAAAPISAASVSQARYDADAPLVTGGVSFSSFQGGFSAVTGKSGRVCVAAPAMMDALPASKQLTLSRVGYLNRAILDHVYDYDGGSHVFALQRQPELRGTVLVPGGGPPPIGLRVEIEGESRAVQVSATGTFSMESVPVGPQRIRIRNQSLLLQAGAGVAQASTNFNVLAAGSIDFQPDAIIERDFVVPFVAHTVTFLDGDGLPLAGGNHRMSASTYAVPAFTSGGLTFTGTATHYEIRTGASHTMSWLAPLAATGASYTVTATPNGHPQRSFLSTYPASGDIVIRVDDPTITAVLAESSGVPLGRVSTSDLRVTWSLSSAGGVTSFDAQSTIVDALGATVASMPAGSLAAEIDGQAHYTIGSSGAVRYARSRFEVVASDFHLAASADVTTTLRLNTRRLLVTVQDRFGVPIPGVTLTTSLYSGASDTLDGVPWGELRGSAQAALGPEAQIELVLPRTKVNQQFPLSLTPPQGTGFAPLTVPTDLREDTGITVVLAERIIGSECDADGVADATDNCECVFNPLQTDSDLDGTGDACECVGVTCDDGDPCTDDTCRASDGTCHFVDKPGPCGGCSPTPELCDGEDNDCDGVVDNHYDVDCDPAIVFYASVANDEGVVVGTVRCFRNGDHVACDTRSDDPDELEIYPAMLCPQ